MKVSSKNTGILILSVATQGRNNVAFIHTNYFGHSFRLTRGKRIREEVGYIPMNIEYQRCFGKVTQNKVLERNMEKNPYSSTIILPETEFSQRANAVRRDVEIQNFWNDYDIYDKISNTAQSNGMKRFVLHDGPPYANGNLHIGHALNKILKDFINRKEVLNRKKVHYLPGWDCHGLPIELKVLHSLKMKERNNLTIIGLRKKASYFAIDSVEKQSQEFQRYGIFGDFNNAYLTLHPKYEAAQVGVFGDMFRKGYISRGRKPVYWSPSSQTALAEAELEYPEGHISKSIYVTFDVESPCKKLEDFHCCNEKRLKLVIWTTTPWTIPANLAVSVNPALKYAVVEHSKTGRLIVARNLVKSLASKFDVPEDEGFIVLATLTGNDIIGTTYKHPLHSHIMPVITGGDYITADLGTGLVHTAPGHGHDDYYTGIKSGLELFSPVDDVGNFSIKAGSRFSGMEVLGKGNLEVIYALDEKESLLKVEDYCHKYPYDWRTKKPIIVRATNQWFANIKGFRDEVLKAVDTVRWIPDLGKKRIISFVTGRGEWCISRQRPWGVPIPVFYDKETCQKILLDERTLFHIQNIFQKNGSESWWTMNERELLPDVYKDQAEKWIKGTDTMDVWFDSGSSWAAVTKGREELCYPADVYLEGSDQHRGWFQSSLLLSVATQGKAPYRIVLTHGFVLDEKGFKMSKSLGNVISPLSIIEGGNNRKTDPPYGADVLRLWVASVDYMNDVCIGKNIIKQVFENYRKLRNTAKYMLGTLADFIPSEAEGSNAIPYQNLPSIDKWMLGCLSSAFKIIDNETNNYQFTLASQELLRFSTIDLSNFYLDFSKDRLYISQRNDYRRRSCQTVIYACLIGFTKAIAPFLPHLAEDIWQNLPFQKSTVSVFEGGCPSHLISFPLYDNNIWFIVRNLRSDINKLLELARNNKIIGASMDAAAYIYVADDDQRSRLSYLVGDEYILQTPMNTNGVDDLRTVLMLSQVFLVESADEVLFLCDKKYIYNDTSNHFVIGIKKAVGKKCQRCWYYDNQVGKLEPAYGEICERCHVAISTWEDETGERFFIK